MLKCRILGGFGALMLVGTAMVAGAGRSGAVPAAATTSDTLAFSGKVLVEIPATAGSPGFAVFSASACSLKSAGEATPLPCSMSATASLTLTGGTITGSIASGDGTITFDEAFVYPTPTTANAVGSNLESDADDPTAEPGTATSTLAFSAPVTDPGDIVDFTGSAVFKENPEGPSCQITGQRGGPPVQQDVTVQDPENGLKSITNIQITNGTVHVPTFAQGTTSPVVVTATKTNPAQRTRWSFDATSVDGVTTHCA